MCKFNLRFVYYIIRNKKTFSWIENICISQLEIKCNFHCRINIKNTSTGTWVGSFTHCIQHTYIYVVWGTWPLIILKSYREGIRGWSLYKKRLQIFSCWICMKSWKYTGCFSNVLLPLARSIPIFPFSMMMMAPGLILSPLCSCHQPSTNDTLSSLTDQF